ncbi:MULTISPECIES: hypothetical protein [Nitrosomonas]|uniref:Uncharacterized protein n=1 Tax=Nitrosomonas communis TaxID=44574 RepID=A0A0F7KDQ7_9PROT|nr:MULTISPECIES: hypothetical protein [Nitrosomonas]AKH36879.1 hypothetical protein AAW31_02190 [Nitrosomonas communis]TYP83901.1 hypothetical protein BCL69_104027 [Nitrosomonas communis]UVS61984.1 hypothetical protein NX761_02305 [Nitrosomonas sp. PLL12]
MEKNATHTPIYTKTQGGVIVQTGNSSNFTMRDSSAYLAIKQRGLELQELYRKNDLVVHPESYLSKLIEDTAMLSDAWLCNDEGHMKISYLFSASQLNRIATAALPLRVSEQAKEYLSALLIGSLDLLNRERSKAKDTLWELELWQALARMGMHATLEEPDIVVSFDGARIGIACKKFYSENNVSKVLSQAVSQLEGNFDFGMIAINLDDLTPPNNILKATSIDQMLEMISQLNFSFIRRHERHFRKYLEPGRAIAAFVSTSVISDVITAKPRFNNSRQSTLWTIPELSSKKAEQMRNFFNAVNSAHV